MQFSSELFIFTFLALLSPISSITNTTSASHHKRPKTHHTINVDPSGKGHFKTIQAAIDSVSSNNKHWTYIHIKRGVYREQVSIPSDKPFIFLKGEGERNTKVIWDAHDSIATSATFSSYADNTIAKSIRFVNSYNSPQNGSHRNPMKPAVAAKIQGDKSAFYRCGFYGLQDTLWDVQGRHYFKQCTIQGAVDFIFGAGQSLYEKCSISVVAKVGRVTGYITAQGRSKASETNGFVFKECDINGKGKTYLGRPWRDYATVLFFNTSMSDIVVPQGWTAWFSVGREKQLTFAEYKCRGKGSDTSKRVKWANKISEKELKKLTSISFIDNEGWIRRQA